jgi:FAD/FMN-containing dehydrogenase
VREARACARPSTVVNDIHSRLNETRVDAVVQPASRGELRRAMRAAAANDAPVSLAGGRYAMGGQQFRTGSLLIDMSGLNRVRTLDREAGVVEVEGGIQWPELVAWLAREQHGEHRPWGIVQKQTGADRLSIGGALSANVHGRGLVHRPIIQDVESLVLLGPDGSERICSREYNAELFSLAIGGYGLFGPIVSVRLRLTRRHKLERIVELLDVDDIAAAFEQRIAAGFEFGDFQFSTDERDESFLRRGVFSCYRPVPEGVPVPANRAELSEAEWTHLAYLAHADRAQAFDTYAGFYLSTSGQIYWSDTHQMSYYRDDYHVALSQQLGERHASSEMISEIYVPRPALADFMGAAGDVLRDASAPLIYGTVRLIERDGESYLEWAREPWACIIFNLHVDHTEAGIGRARGAFLRLIDAALDRGGSYYLTYHRWARRDQVHTAHPRLASFLRRKRRYDPEERFQSDWYCHYRNMFADARLG